jgi:hypothetical protein
MGLENQSLNPVNVNMTLECEHDIRIGVFTVRGNYFVAVFLSSFLPQELHALNAGPRLSNEH